MLKRQMNCDLCPNATCVIKKHSHAPVLQKHLGQKHMFRCNKGQQFILEGAPVNGLYFIHDGCVKVSKQTANLESQIIRFSKNGEIVGHRGFGTSFVYDISAAALDDTVLCHFASDTLIEMMHLYPPLMFDFMLFYAEQLQKSEANAIRFGKMSVRDKVVNGLLFIKQKFGQTDGFFNITLSRKDIADFAGTSQEQVIRVISTLKKEGLLVAKGKRLGIPDLPKMESELVASGYFLEG
jgi:CRP/FNR family transcriptional regulator, anaerobic regulatory protein